MALQNIADPSLHLISVDPI